MKIEEMKAAYREIREKISPDDRYTVFVFGFLMIVVIVSAIWR
jgi:hypothetical protein